MNIQRLSTALGFGTKFMVAAGCNCNCCCNSEPMREFAEKGITG